jgi:hypothetical protein
MLSALSSRTAFTWLRERDIDLLLCAELHGDAALTELFRAKMNLGSASFIGAWVSHTEVDGQSDLVVGFSNGEKTTLALVENKIAADFQPDQAVRYRQRALRWAATEGVTAVLSLLVAPGDYLVRPGAEVFQIHISYEEIADAMQVQGDLRSLFLAKSLLAGVESYRRGYIMQPDEQVSNMWRRYWEAAEVVAPELRLAEPRLKPGHSTWIYFREAAGFSKTDRKKAVVVLKAERGQADLQFKVTSRIALERRTLGILEPLMRIVGAGKSAAIRLDVPKANFREPPQEQENSILAGLSACERLRSFFVRNRVSLLDES